MINEKLKPFCLLLFWSLYSACVMATDENPQEVLDRCRNVGESAMNYMQLRQSGIPYENANDVLKASTTSIAVYVEGKGLLDAAYKYPVQESKLAKANIAKFFFRTKGWRMFNWIR